MFFVGEFHEGSRRFFFLPRVGARSAFCECQRIRKIAFKNGEKILWEEGVLSRFLLKVLTKVRQGKGRAEQRFR